MVYIFVCGGENVIGFRQTKMLKLSLFYPAQQNKVGPLAKVFDLSALHWAKAPICRLQRSFNP